MGKEKGSSARIARELGEISFPPNPPDGAKSNPGGWDAAARTRLRVCIHCQGGKLKRSEIPGQHQNPRLFCSPSVEVNRAAAERITGKDTLNQRVLLQFPNIYTAIPPPRQSICNNGISATGGSAARSTCRLSLPRCVLLTAGPGLALVCNFIPFAVYQDIKLSCVDTVERSFSAVDRNLPGGPTLRVSRRFALRKLPVLK